MKALLWTLPLIAAAGIVAAPEPQDKGLVGKTVSLQFQEQVYSRGPWDSLAGIDGSVESVDAVGLTIKPSRLTTRSIRPTGEGVLGDAPVDGRFYVPWAAVKCLHYAEK